MSQIQTRHQLRLHSSIENLDVHGSQAAIDSKMASQSTTATTTGSRVKQAMKASQQTPPSTKSTQQGMAGKKDMPKGSPNVKAKVTEIETLSKSVQGDGSFVLSEGSAAGGGSHTRPTPPPPSTPVTTPNYDLYLLATR